MALNRAIDNHAISYYDSPKLGTSNAMVAKYEIGQKVKIRPVNGQRLSPRDCDIEPYAGQIGEVIDYYWISTRIGEVFYIYTIRIEADKKEIVLHEDEIRAYKK